MIDDAVQPPDLLPILSRGKHRSPRKGACFMELASYLAGDRWSDHPACTHPLLAAAARHVNDYTSDVGRPRLAELVPSVIGLTSEDPRVDARIALRCAAYALPVVAAPRQRVLAVSVLVGEHVLAELSGQPPTLGPQSRAALDQVPHAAGWARQLTGAVPTSVRTYRRHAAPTTVRYAVEGVAQACVRHPDEMLRELLQLAITECAAAVERPDHRAAVTVDEWAAACRLTGVGR